MKKLLSLLLAAGLVLSAASAFADAKRLTFATGGTSGVYFPLGGAIGQVISSKSDGKFSVTPQATGASGENMRLVEMGEVDFAIVQNDVADAAYKGSAPFRSKLANVRAIGRLYPEYLHLVASEESGIKSIEQFKGKQVSVGARGSGNEVNCRQIFGFFGLDYKNVEPIFLPYGETADQFKDRHIDAFVFTIGTPNHTWQMIDEKLTDENGRVKDFYGLKEDMGPDDFDVTSDYDRGAYNNPVKEAIPTRIQF